MNTHFHYGHDHLTAGIALAIATGKRKGIINEEAALRIDHSVAVVAQMVEKGDPVYGVNTGFGSLCTTKISAGDTRKLQHNLLKSHSVGVGRPIQTIIAKLMLILKVHSLAYSYSGVARTTLERIIWHIDNDIIPVVPSQGSVGASGDLAPLAHLFLPLIGFGKVEVNGEVKDTADVLAAHQLPPLELGPKEGLGLINGTQFIAAHAVYALDRFNNALDTADIIAAMSLEALEGSRKPFLEALHNLRPYKGNHYVAHRMRTLLENSQILASHAYCGRVQDPYSLRCIPQVHGASRNAYLHLREMLEIELNSVTDNPIIFSDGTSISGGNFHGQPMAIPLDYATVAVSELGNISDRRIYMLLEGTPDGSLPQLLMKDTGINSGFMIPQYTSAALATENKTLCFPASADSIPTSLGQEDHVSMGSVSGRKLVRVLENVEHILSVELLSAAQAFDFRAPLKSGPILEACHDLVREHIDHANEDRIFGEDLAKAKYIVHNKLLVECSVRAALENGIRLNNKDEELFSRG